MKDSRHRIRFEGMLAEMADGRNLPVI